MNRTIILGSKNNDALISFLQSLNETTECEVRFGSFSYKDASNKSEFISNVEIDFFYRLKKIIDNQEGLERTETFTKELSYDNADDKRGKIREIIHTNNQFIPTGKKEYMLKNTHRKHDIFDYDCRASLSSEKMLIKERIRGVNFNNPSFIRYKHRISYTFGCGVLDMTIVKQGSNEHEAMRNTQYEIEFEVTKNDYESILEILTFILSVRQNNFYVINTGEKRDIINQYRSLVMPQKKGHPYFIGAQPETLQKDQLSLLFKELYSVTDKADGDRYFMFVDNKGYVSFIDNNISNIMKTDLKSETFKDCLIDGELIRNVDNNQLSKISFYAFDIIFVNSVDLRGDNNYHLKQRLDKLNDVIKSVSSSEFYNIDMKKFIYRNVFMGADIIMKTIKDKPYENDGLIFTPMNEPYPTSKKWIKLLKWKPAQLNTIDFYSIKKSDEQGNSIWELYVQDSIIVDNQERGRKTELVLFDINKLCGVSDKTNITFKTSFDDNLLDPTTNEPYKTRTVIEYKWVGDKFMPLRTRWDKTSNPSKHGNFSAVACSIWNNINNPITPTQLFQMTNTSTEQVGGNADKFFFFERMNFFHNKINQYLINKYTQNTQNDLTTSVYGKELTEESILELNTFNQIKGAKTVTFCNSIKKSNFNYKNFKLDLTADNACDIVCQNNPNKMSTVFCLKFNEFFKSKDTLDNFIKIVDYNIKTNGKLILSFLDSDKIKNSKHCIISNEIMYIIDKKIENNPLFNNYIKMFINGVSNESEPIEYIVNPSYLIEYLASKGYKCIESESYKELYNMYIKNDTSNILNNYEKDISDLYKFCVFEKHETKVTSILNNKTDSEIDNQEKMHLIEYKNLKFHKIQCSYDIFNLLNCINYTVFKNMHTNFEIKSFDDIKSVLSSVNSNIQIHYKQTRAIDSDKQYMYVYKSLFEEEQTQPSESNEILEPIIIEQFYIILYNHSIIQTKDSIIKIQEELNNTPKIQIKTEKVKEIKENIEHQVEAKVEDKVEAKEEVKEDVKEEDVPGIFRDTIKNDMKTLGKKITLVKIKYYLKQLNCKTSGNKDELLQRLNEQLN